MSQSTTKLNRRVIRKAEELAEKKLQQKHREIIESYLDGYCKMSRKSRRKFARMIRKGINPLKAGEGRAKG